MRAAARLNTPRAARPKLALEGAASGSACLLLLVPTTKSDCDGPVRDGRPGWVGSCRAGRGEAPLSFPACASKSGVERDMRENMEGVADLRGVRGGGPRPKSYGPKTGASGAAAGASGAAGAADSCCYSGNGNAEGGEQDLLRCETEGRLPGEERNAGASNDCSLVSCW